MDLICTVTRHHKRIDESQLWVSVLAIGDISLENDACPAAGAADIAAMRVFQEADNAAPARPVTYFVNSMRRTAYKPNLS